MMYHKSIKITIDAFKLAKMISNVVVQHHKLLDLIITNKNLLFILKFWSSLQYILKIKQQLFFDFYLSTDSQTKYQNNAMEMYFQDFINFKQNIWARLILMAKFTYNNAKNVSISYTFFELNCNYYFQISYKNDVEFHSKLKLADKLSAKLRKPIIFCCKNLYYGQELQKQAIKVSSPKAISLMIKFG